MHHANLALVIHLHLPFNVEEAQPQELIEQYIALFERLEKIVQANPRFRATIAVSSSFMTVMNEARTKALNITTRLLSLYEKSNIDLIACTASNAPLPLFKTEEAIRAQISVGVAEFKRCFGIVPKGIWIPECAFTTGIDRILRELNIQYFFVNSQSLLFASPRPNQLLAAPLLTPYGVSAFARHNSLDFYKHNKRYTEYINPYIQKEIDLLAVQADRKPILVNILQTPDLADEWHIFLDFLEMVGQQNERSDCTVTLSTVQEYLHHYPMSDTGMLNANSITQDSYFETWLQPSNDWIYRHLHEAEQQLIDHANCFATHKLTKLVTRALNQAVRELFLAQSSDIAVGLCNPLLAKKTTTRFKQHILQMKACLQMVGHDNVDAAYIKKLEQQTPIYPELSFREFVSHDLEQIVSQPFLQKPKLARGGKRILMLAWEFPPLVVGGLARAVFDLSKHLVAHGHEIHVVTTEVPGSPAYEFMDGIHVHRMHVLRTNNLIEFLDWVYQMNTVFTDYVLRLQSFGKQFDVIHDHDLLVYYAARELKYSLKIPLVATIHATEHGRNHGKISSPIQNRIAELEWNLTYEAAHVISCSSAMENEVKHIFQLPPDKVSMIHNGVDLPQISDAQINWSQRERYAYPGEKIVFYVGRLVYEKGIHVLIEAMPQILQSYPNCKLIIAGAGSMKDDLQRRAAYLGHKVLFVGFVDDETRNFLLKVADVCVFPSLYEPFGIVALEAMNIGTPVVVSDVGGLAEIIEHGKDGYKALPGHIDSLSWHIADLLHHPQKAKAMAKLAKEKTIHQYNWKQIAKRTVDVYQIAIKRMNSGG